MDTVDISEAAAVAEGLPVTPDQPGVMPVPSADELQPFRFTAAASLSPARQESLEAWHRPFLRVAASNLRTALRLDLDLALESIRVETCAHFLAHRHAHDQALLFRMAPLPDLWLLDIPLPLAHLSVERMMGGNANKLPAGDETKDLTELELIILNQFAQTLLADYARNWQAPADYKPEIVRHVRLVRVARAVGHDDDDLLVRIGLRLTLKDGESIFAIHMPIAVAEELLQRLGAGNDVAATPATMTMPPAQSPLACVPVPVAVRWQGFQITLREVESLAPGDVLMLDNKKCEHGVVWLGDRARFAGKIAREAHKTVITLTQPLE